MKAINESFAICGAEAVFNETIRLDKVQSGIYMLQVSDGLNKQTKKVIIN